MSSCRNMEQPQQLANSRSEGTNSTAKRVVSRKAPVIKQTLTSLYRIAKANPLLVLQGDANQQANDFGLNNMKLPKSVLLPNTCRTFNSETFTNKSIVNINEQRSAPFSRSASLKIKSDASYNKTQLKRTTSVRKPSTSKHEPKHETRCISEHGKVLKSAIPAVTSNKPAKTSSVSNLATAVKKSIKPEKRRSLSAEHYDRKKGLLKIKTVQLMNTRKGIQPLNDMGKMAAALPPAVSPIIEEFRTVSFKTPSMRKKRSISMTSITPFHKHFTSTPRSTINDLGQRLREWLQSHQKPVDTYKHLKCFGLHNSSDDQAQFNDENKENREALTKATSYENLKIAPDDSLCVVSDLTSTNGNGNSYIDNQPIVQDALADLHKLILDGYPHQQCEAWLGMMRQKCNSLDEEPQYWECRAAIEQTRGNITSAVECLRTAIVQGAELKAVDHSLEQLLQKFCLLNISDHSDQDKNNMQKTDRARIVLDARNVFKSSIIQFAVQERALKTKLKQEGSASEKKFIATPVRRSTRQSRSVYTSTPGVTLCASLNELDENISNNLSFCGNIALYQ